MLDAFNINGCSVDRFLLPKALRRRTSLSTQMAISVAESACQQAGQTGETLAAIFASVGGEIQITDILCRDITDMETLLSPTQFHNSVHNTTAGYWSIVKGCQAPITSIAACDDTLAMGLLEAWSQMEQGAERALLVCYDEEWPQYLAPPMGKIAFACALVLSRVQLGALGHKISKPSIDSTINSVADANPALSELIKSAPAANIIPLLKAINDEKKQAGSIPLTHDDTRVRWKIDLECGNKSH